MISCDDAMRQLWEHLALPPTAADQALLEAHLAVCRRCCGEAQFVTELCAALRRVGTEDLPPSARQRFEALISQLEEQT